MNKIKEDGKALSTDQFAHNVRRGLSSSPKYLLSKYFYDEKGDQLFQEIMNLKEYYLTECEHEIINNNKRQLLDIFKDSGTPFQLIELGAGDAVKTQILLKHFQQKKTEFTYVPIDISQHVLTLLESDLFKNLPSIDVRPFQGEYFTVLDKLNNSQRARKVLLFLGSTIGNFSYADALNFLKKLNRRMHNNEQVLIGFDLKKDPQLILRAYNDIHGITARFNLNLLKRINKELGGNFKEDNFYHYPVYDPISGEAKSYLISKFSHSVKITQLNRKFHFEKGEAIYMEISKKYDLQELDKLAQSAGFKIKKRFLDKNQYFADVLFEKR
ncbi:MAG: L-histidine N(alpha)-methyltransferase [Bacteroidales bacterium]